MRLQQFLARINSAENQKYLITFCILLALKVFFTDQLTKDLVLALFSEYKTPSIKVTSFLNFIELYNKGISFGLFSTFGNEIFIMLSLTIIIVLCRWYYSQVTFATSIATASIVGGAAGNIFDRIVRSAVLDFLDFHIDTWHYPTFNIADSAIVLGVILLLLIIIREK